MKNLVLGFIFSLCCTSQAAEDSLNTAAKKIASLALKEAQIKKKCIAVAIVDHGGNLFYFEKDSCAHLGGGETAIQKARSANAFRKPTSDFVQAIKEGRHGILVAKDVFPVEGGLPIVINGIHVGAIGVGGATSIEDESFAKAALTKIESNK